MTIIARDGDATLRSIDVEHDAAKLAAMWNASSSQWPGGWNQGVPWQPANAVEWLGRQQAVDMLVWEVGDEIAGFCSFWARPEEPGVYYIAIVNVAPAFQGRSLARKFLVHFVERARQLGASRLDLNTWSGNLKAVPLYKKCGFCWLPGTSVRMHNYLPAILNLPLARPFFERHDWYSSFQRALTQVEDKETWQGMEVFSYRFAAGGEQLNVWVDRQARAITAVETDDLLVAALARVSEPPRGLPTIMRWRLTNKRNQPLPVTLIASGNDDLRLELRESLTLAAGESREIEATVHVSATMAEVASDKPAPAIRSLLLLDGQPLELRTGLRPQAAVAVSTHPPYVTLIPGVPQTVELQLASHVQSPLAASVSLTPEAGLHVDWTEQRLELAAEARFGLALTLRAEAGGVYQLPVALRLEHEGQATHLPASPQAIFALPPGGVLGANLGDKLRIENEHGRMLLEKIGSDLHITASNGEELLTLESFAAPPVNPSEWWNNRFELKLEQSNGAVLAEAVCESKDNPGFVLRKRLTVNAGPLAELAYEFENRASEERRFQVYQEFTGNGGDATCVLPLAAGVTEGRWEVFPGYADTDFCKPANFAERWLALEFRQATVGLLWGADVEKVAWALSSRHYECPPQGRVQPDSLHIYMGAGGWQAVQRAYRRMVGLPATPPPAATPFFSARLEPAPLLLNGDEAEATLVVEQRTHRPISGSVEVQLPEAWTLQRRDAEAQRRGEAGNSLILDFEGVKWDTPFRVPLTLRTSAVPGAYVGRLLVHGDERDLELPLPLFRLGDGSQVQVQFHEQHGQPVRTIGVNQLASPFPAASAIGWISPWYGGITPVLEAPGEQNFPGALWRESFSVELLAMGDMNGLQWQGVVQRAELSSPKLRGLRLELETLTLGGSPLVKLVYRLHNRSSATMRVPTAGWLVFVAPGGVRGETVLWGPNEQLKPGEDIVWLQMERWAAAQHPASGTTLALVSANQKLGIVTWGDGENHLYMTNELVVPAHGSAELVAYLVLADDLEEARRYRQLTIDD
ncbi:MAG: GNAT family N-acetyltransferase [Chloroflexaceae bacterium]|nr:GNAT family N-acetyltransferase [Chloroflexaceae bacterium]